MATGDQEFDTYYKIVVQNTSARLIDELKKAFSHANSHALIDTYSRDEILDLVIACRRGAGSTSAIKQVIDASADALVKYHSDNVTGRGTVTQQTKTATTTATTVTQTGVATYTIAGAPAAVSTPAQPVVSGSGPPDLSSQFNGLAAILAHMQQSAMQQQAEAQHIAAERDARLQLELCKQQAVIVQQLADQQSTAAARDVEAQRVAAERDARLQLELAVLKEQSEQRAEQQKRELLEREEQAAQREIRMLAELKRSLICETKEVVDQAQREEGSRIAEALQLQTDAARAAEHARHDSRPERIASAETVKGHSCDYD